ncbi:hypothetical protein D3C86_982290 [compost metagenome]
MTPERSQRNNDAGTNPNIIPQHLENVPFDNTSIQEAVDNNIIDTTPDTDQLKILQSGDYRSPRPPAKEVPLNSSEYQVPVEKKKGRGRLYTILGGAAATAVAATALFLLPKGENNNNENKPVPTQPVATAETTPGQLTESAEPTLEAVKSYEKPFTVESMQIPSGLSAEEYGEALITDRYTRWIMAGTTEENEQAFFDNGGDETILANVADKNATIVAEALYVPDWKNKRRLVEYLDTEKDLNRANLAAWVRTNTSQGPVEEEAFEETVTLVSAEQLSGDATTGRVINFTAVQHNNSSMNIIGELAPSRLASDGRIFSVRFTTTVMNGKELISDVDTTG